MGVRGKVHFRWWLVVWEEGLGEGGGGGCENVATVLNNLPIVPLFIKMAAFKPGL